MTSITEPPGQIPTDLVWWRTKLYSKSRKKSRKRCWKCLLFPRSGVRLDVVCISVCNKLFLRDIGLGFQGPGAPDQEAGPGLVINLFSLKNPDALNDRLGITPSCITDCTHHQKVSSFQLAGRGWRSSELVR